MDVGLTMRSCEGWGESASVHHTKRNRGPYDSFYLSHCLAPPLLGMPCQDMQIRHAQCVRQLVRETIQNEGRGCQARTGLTGC